MANRPTKFRFLICALHVHKIWWIIYMLTKGKSIPPSNLQNTSVSHNKASLRIPDRNSKLLLHTSQIMVTGHGNTHQSGGCIWCVQASVCECWVSLVVCAYLSRHICSLRPLLSALSLGVQGIQGSPCPTDQHTELKQ